MAIVNGYCTLDALKRAVGITDMAADPELEAAIEAASRQIDAACGQGRKFWQDSTAVARYFRPSDSRVVFVDDISTVTGLIVAVDLGDDGTHETTLTINSDFIVEPVNAAAEYPVRPYTSVRLVGGALSSWPTSTYGRAPVKVTAKFGWPAVPDAIERACLMQARQVYKSPDAMFGAFQLSLDGQPMRIPALDPMTKALIEDFIRWDDVDA